MFLSNTIDWAALGIVAAVLIVLIVVLNFFLSPIVQSKMLVKEMIKKTDVKDAYKEADFNSPWYQHIIEIKKAYKELVKIGWKEVTIKSFDNINLYGYLFSKPNHAKGTIILVHSCHSYALREFAPLANFYYAEGYNVLVIDQRCHNKSEGSYITYGFDEHKDLIDWVKFIDNYYEGKYNIYLHGIDLGAGVVAMVANKGLEDKVKGLIMEECYLDGNSLFQRFVINNGRASNPAMTMKFANKYCKRALKFSLDQINPLECIKETTIPCLFIVGSDYAYGTHETDTLYKECGASKKEMFVSFGATHGECYYRKPNEYLASVKNLLKGEK